MAKKNPTQAPRQYRVLWAMMADPNLSAAAKCVGTVLLLKFRNHSTGKCNPSFEAIASVVGRSRRAVINAIFELKSGADPWIVIKGTTGGSRLNTNNFEFPRTRLRIEAGQSYAGEADCTGEAEGLRSEADFTQGVKHAAHELSSKPSQNYSAASALRPEERAPLPNWAQPAGPGRWFVKIESEGGDLVRQYCTKRGKILPVISQRLDAYIVDFIDALLDELVG